MKRRRLISVFMCAALLIAPDASAQFFKKLGKALQEVDKALGGTEQKKENTQTQDPKEVTSDNNRSTQNGIYTGNLNTNTAKPIIPHVTSKTKVIYMEENPRFYLDRTEFCDGMAFIGDKKGQLFIDTLGNTIFQFKYTLPFNANYPRFYNGVCPVHDVGNVTWLINKKGEKIVKLPGIFRVTNFIDGVAAGLVSVQKGYSKYSKVVYINTKGQLIYPNLSEPVRGSLEEPRPLCEGLAAFYSYSKQAYGFRDKNGQIIIAPNYAKVKDFSDGMAAVQLNDGKWGFIDIKGNMIISAEFSNEPSSFSEGCAVVKKRDGVRCFIDKQGNIVRDNFKQASTFHNGYAYIVSAEGDRKMQIINKDFKVVSNIDHMPYDEALEKSLYFKDNMILYFREVYISPLGDELMTAEVLEMFYNGLAFCRSKDETIGYINKRGEYVVCFKEKTF